MNEKTLGSVEKELLTAISDLHEIPEGAYSIRQNGASFAARSTDHIVITPREAGDGFTMLVKADTQGESVHIPVLISQAGIEEAVYNDFIVEDGADVTVIAGCGIHNCGTEQSAHNGIHTFKIGKGAHLRYVEKHYGDGDGDGSRIMNPHTVLFLDEGARVEMETQQIRGLDRSCRKTDATLEAFAVLEIREAIMTAGVEYCETDFTVHMNGEGSAANLVSRSVAKGESEQIFRSRINGNAACTGHSECDAILMDRGHVTAIPELTANHLDASLIHEAAIGKIAGEQLTKLMTLGLTEEEAEAEIVNGFLK